jgi:predicted transposase
MLKKILNAFRSKSDKKPISKMSNQYNELTEEELHERFSVLDFTWIKGDNTGNSERFVRINSVDLGNGQPTRFIQFQGGNRINVDLISEYMAMFPKAPDNVNFNPAPQATPQILQLQKPDQKKPTTTSVESISYGESQVKNNTHDENSPIYKLLSKQKKNMIDVSIKLKMNLPSKELYTVLIDSFEGAESEVINYIIDGIEIDEIKKSLAESIKKNYYNLTPKVAPEKPSKSTKSTETAN